MKFTDLVPGTLYAYTNAAIPRAHDWRRALLIEKGGWAQLSAYGSPRQSSPESKDSLVLIRNFGGKDAGTVEEARAYPIESARRWAKTNRQLNWRSEATEEELVDAPPKGWGLMVAKPQNLRMTWADYEVAAEQTRKVQEEQAAVRAAHEAALEVKRQARLAALADLGIPERYGLVDRSGEVHLRGAEFDGLLARLREGVRA